MTKEEIQKILDRVLIEHEQNLWEESNSSAIILVNYFDSLHEKSSENIEILVKVILLIAVNLRFLGKLEEAFQQSTKALKLSEEYSLQKFISESSLVLGEVYLEFGNYQKALESFTRSLTIAESIEDTLGILNSTNNIGNVYNELGDYFKALEYYSESLTIKEEIGDKKGISASLSNIGLVYTKLGDYQRALDFYSESLKIKEQIGNKRGIGITTSYIGVMYEILGDLQLALQYHHNSLNTAKEIGDKKGISVALSNIGNVHNSLFEYEKALEFHSKSLSIAKEINDTNGIAASFCNIGIVYFSLKAYDKALEFYIQALKIAEDIGEKNGIAVIMDGIGKIYSNLEYTHYNPQIAEKYLQKSLQLCIEIGFKEGQKNAYSTLSQLFTNEEQYKEAFEYYKKSIEVEKELLTVEASSNARNLEHRRKFEEMERDKNIKLARFQEQEKILHNILPINIAERIIKQETFIADYFESVSVLFMDLVGFTPLSSIAPPKQLVFLLDAIFQKADEVVESFGLEKIKTIGDGYLAVANVTTPLEHHQKATAQAALKLIEVMKDFVVYFPSDLGNTEWTKDMKDLEIRIGIHTGEVVAGIIGKNKYTYDLWGDAVNIASRMESNSEPWKIHVSDAFAKAIETYPEFSLISRGEISIKGKGAMNTYWLEKAK